MQSTITPEFVAQRLRTIRNSRSMSLLDVEKASAGAIKAVVLGSYERGSRALSVKRAIQLADFYGIPVHTLFGSSVNEKEEEPGRLAIDLRKGRLHAESRTSLSVAQQGLDFFPPFFQFVRHIQNLREDWNGEIISLRSGDLELLAVYLGTTQKMLITWLHEENLLFAKKP